VILLLICPELGLDGKSDSVASFACGGVPLAERCISSPFNLLHKLSELV
jgi:hypothetical protein